ncbi:MAG: nucleotidyltransferase domain-containing protein [Bacteroidales bacterium]
MTQTEKILARIKKMVIAVEPGSTIILYGSYARGDNRADSDIDLLILLDKDQVTFKDKKRITYPLFDLEFETGQIISPLVFAKKDWETRHRITPLYHNILREGKVL